MPYAIRSGEQGDYGQVGDLLVRVYIGEGFSPASAAESLADVARRAASAELLVAADGAAVLGAAFLVVDGPLRQIGRVGEAELRTLAVEPAARGAGVGTALVRACIERAHRAGAATVVLSTQPSMAAAQRLYERLGFVRDPVRDWRRGNGQPMLAFELLLHPASLERVGDDGA